MDDDTKSRMIEPSKWGPKLFMATAIGVAVFFWWMLIYSGGVVSQHG